MKNLVGIADIDDGPVRENALHAGLEYFPLRVAPEVVAHEKSAAQQIIPQLLGLGVGEAPPANLDRIQPGPVIDVVTVVEVHWLFNRSGVDARQPPHRPQEVAVRTRIVLRPHGVAVAPVAPAAPISVAKPAISLRVHETCEGPLGLLLVIGWQREIVVLNARVFAERLLECKRSAEKSDHATRQPRDSCPGAFHQPRLALL